MEKDRERKGADEGNLLTLLRKERGEHGKESFDRKRRRDVRLQDLPLNAAR